MEHRSKQLRQFCPSILSRLNQSTTSAKLRECSTLKGKGDYFSFSL